MARALLGLRGPFPATVSCLSWERCGWQRTSQSPGNGLGGAVGDFALDLTAQAWGGSLMAPCTGASGHDSGLTGMGHI